MEEKDRKNAERKIFPHFNGAYYYYCFLIKYHIIKIISLNFEFE